MRRALFTFIWIALMASAVLAQWPQRGYVPLRNNMIAHWRLEEPTGSSRFDSIGTNHLTVFNTVTQTNGVSGQGIAVGATSINLLSAANCLTNFANLARTNFTLSVWFMLTNVPQPGHNPFIVSMRSATTTEWSLYAVSNVITEIHWQTHDGSFRDLSQTNPAVQINQWNLFIGWKSGTYFAGRLYTPGRPQGTTTNMTVSGTVSCCANLTIGSGSGHSSPDQFRGRIDSVTIWNRMLTTNEMDWIWNQGQGGLDNFTVASGP